MQITVQPYHEIAESVRAIRETVFIEEQKVSRDDEFDGRDEECIQVLACDGDTLLGTGRLDPNYDGKVGRVAVLKEHRRKGIGRRIMQALEQEAVRIGLKRIWFHAQLRAVPFYERLGYQSEGPIFQEAGIDHVKMSRNLSVSRPSNAQPMSQ